jgi:penicillin amidase
MRANLPQLDGSLTVYGLNAPVTVERDAHGVPHIHASSLDDLIFAQGYVTAQDRLWQMDLLRRHAAGELAAVFGRSMLEHDRLQRTLQMRAAADNALAALPADQKHWLEVYARGVNASIDRPARPPAHRVPPARLHARPVDAARLAAGRARHVQDLTTGFPAKLGREALAAHLPPDLIADLYPVGSWRDHPPGQPIPDVTAPQPEIKDIPLDESQSKLAHPPRHRQVWISPGSRTCRAQRQASRLFHPLRLLRRRLQRLGRLRLAHRLGQADALERYAPLAGGARHLV